MLNKLSCLAATFLVYDEHEPFDRVVQASSLYRISVSTTRAASSSLRRGARGAARRASSANRSHPPPDHAAAAASRFVCATGGAREPEAPRS
jgi:hypothetical protein